jgi:hypothetical protein
VIETLLSLPLPLLIAGATLGLVVAGVMGHRRKQRDLKAIESREKREP